MENLKGIIKDIEDTGKLYRNTNDSELRESYNYFIELRILEAPQFEHNNLYNRWSREAK